MIIQCLVLTFHGANFLYDIISLLTYPDITLLHGFICYGRFGTL